MCSSSSPAISSPRTSSRRWAGGGFTLWGFWDRRIRRIWPAALATTAAALALGWVVMLPLDYRALAADAVSQVAMLTNVRMLDRPDYFNQRQGTVPLLHMWSLAAEEQFYLVHPLVLMALRRASRRALASCLGALALASLVASSLWLGRHPSAVFYLLPFRAWEILIGALLALTPPMTNAPRGWSPSLRAAGLATLGIACFTYDSATPFPGVSAVVPCLAAACIIAAGIPADGAAAGWLGCRPMQAVGRASYSLYLWHWLVFSFTCYVVGPTWPWATLLASLAATSVLAGLSWWLIEEPCRRPRTDPGRRRVLVGCMLLSCMLLGISLRIYSSDGVWKRFAPDTIDLFDQGFDRWDWNYDAPAKADVSRSLKPMGQPGDDDAACFLLWGDSHAMMIAPVVHDLARRNGMHGRAAIQGGLPPLVGVHMPLATERGDRVGPPGFNHGVLEWVRRNRPAGVLLCSRWSVHVTDRRTDQRGERLVVPVGETLANPARSQEAMRHSLLTFIDECERLGTRVWLLLEVPCQADSPRQRIALSRLTGQEVSLEGIDRPTHAGFEALVRRSLPPARDGVFTIVDLAAPFFDGEGRSALARDGTTLYKDDDHISQAAASQVLRPILESILGDIRRTCGGRGPLGTRPRDPAD